MILIFFFRRVCASLILYWTLWLLVDIWFCESVYLGNHCILNYDCCSISSQWYTIPISGIRFVDTVRLIKLLFGNWKKVGLSADTGYFWFLPRVFLCLVSIQGAHGTVHNDSLSCLRMLCDSIPFRLCWRKSQSSCVRFFLRGVWCSRCCQNM